MRKNARKRACSMRELYLIRISAAKTSRERGELRAALRRHVAGCEKCFGGLPRR